MATSPPLYLSGHSLPCIYGKLSIIAGKCKHKVSFALGGKYWIRLYFFFCLVSNAVSFLSNFCMIKHLNIDENDFCLNQEVIILISQTAVQILRYRTAI